MTSRDFCYFLQGFFELSPTELALTPAQTALIRKHLALVFLHEIDPSMGPPEHQEKLNEIHSGSNVTENAHFGPSGSADGVLIRC